MSTSARDALAMIQAQPGVREAEVFVAANGVLLTRLNYTSHIPSNGVEEPKSSESHGIATQVDSIQLGRFVAAGSPVFSVFAWFSLSAATSEPSAW